VKQAFARIGRGHSLLRPQTMDDVERAASAATTEEAIEMCCPLASRNGIYRTHMRDEADRVTRRLSPRGGGRSRCDRHRACVVPTGFEL